MKDNISKRDWETISAYLDGQLSERKQARLESRLGKNLQLRIALDEMRHTRQVLRAAPRLRAPRSFLLTPEMAGSPSQLPQLAPVFGWASAIASFLFVLFLVGDLFTPGGAIPMALSNVPTQDEFIAPRGQVVEDTTVAQPAANVGGLEEPSSGMKEVAASPEISDGEVAPESAATEVAAIEPEFPEGEAEAGITVSADLAVETEQGDPKDTGRRADTPEVDANEFVEIASATGTLEAESTPEEHLLAPPVEETEPTEEAQPSEELQPADDVQSQKTETVTQPSAASSLPTEASTEPSPTVEQEPISAEISLKGAPASEKLSSPIIGVEVILGLVALGAGLAWAYLRQRGS